MSAANFPFTRKDTLRNPFYYQILGHVQFNHKLLERDVTEWTFSHKFASSGLVFHLPDKLDHRPAILKNNIVSIAFSFYN